MYVALVSTALPTVIQDCLVKEPESVLERRLVKQKGKATTQILIKWTNQPAEEATWEFLYDLLQKFPTFQP